MSDRLVDEIALLMRNLESSQLERARLKRALDESHSERKWLQQELDTDAPELPPGLFVKSQFVTSGETMLTSLAIQQSETLSLVQQLVRRGAQPVLHVDGQDFTADDVRALLRRVGQRDVTDVPGGYSS